jgi:hypothetical protein
MPFPIQNAGNVISVNLYLKISQACKPNPPESSCSSAHHALMQIKLKRCISKTFESILAILTI